MLWREIVCVVWDLRKTRMHCKKVHSFVIVVLHTVTTRFRVVNKALWDILVLGFYYTTLRKPGVNAELLQAGSLWEEMFAAKYLFISGNKWSVFSEHEFFIC